MEAITNDRAVVLRRGIEQRIAVMLHIDYEDSEFMDAADCCECEKLAGEIISMIVEEG